MIVSVRRCDVCEADITESDRRFKFDGVLTAVAIGGGERDVKILKQDVCTVQCLIAAVNHAVKEAQAS